MTGGNYKIINGTYSEVETELNNLGAVGSIEIVSFNCVGTGEITVLIIYSN